MLSTVALIGHERAWESKQVETVRKKTDIRSFAAHFYNKTENGPILTTRKAQGPTKSANADFSVLYKIAVAGPGQGGAILLVEENLVPPIRPAVSLDHGLEHERTVS